MLHLLDLILVTAGLGVVVLLGLLDPEVALVDGLSLVGSLRSIERLLLGAW